MVELSRQSQLTWHIPHRRLSPISSGGLTAGPLPLDTVGPLPLDIVGPLPLDTAGPLPLDIVGPLPLDTAGPLPLDTAGPLPLDTVGPLPLDTSLLLCLATNSTVGVTLLVSSRFDLLAKESVTDYKGDGNTFNKL